MMLSDVQHPPSINTKFCTAGRARGALAEVVEVGAQQDLTLSIVAEHGQLQIIAAIECLRVERRHRISIDLSVTSCGPRLERAADEVILEVGGDTEKYCFGIGIGIGIDIDAV